MYVDIDETTARITSLRMELADKNVTLNQRLGARDALSSRLTSITGEIRESETRIVTTEKAMWLLQQYGEQQQKQITSHIESVVTKGLQAVFQNPTLEFRLKYSETKKGDKKKLPEIKMAVFYDYNGERVEGSLRSSFGGGLSVVAAVLLRIVVTLHMKHKINPVLILDEPLRDLSPSYSTGDTSDGYRERMSDFLRVLCNETNVQLIVVSHEPEYGRVADIHHEFSGGLGGQTKVKTTIRQEELADGIS